jgi:pSer/pThr/pTyr-binding forkhead associated (FHA) protein
MRARLVLRRRDGTLHSFALVGQARIGSAPISEVMVERDRVSPLHAILTFEDDGYWVEDKQSSYGTFVNGTRIGKTKLRHFDVLTIAPDVSLVFLATQPGSAPVATRVEPVATMEVPRVGAPAMPQFARTMNEPLPEPLRGLAAGGGLPSGVLKAAAEEAGEVEPQPLPTRRLPIDPETISIERRPPAEPLIAALRLVGDSGTFKCALGTCIVGRGSEAGIRINSKEMSRRHAQIVVGPNEITVEDLKSANGTKVNGIAATEPTTVSDGDTVSFAAFKFRVEIDRLVGEG